MNSNSFSQQPKNEGQTQTAIMQGVTSAPNAASLVQPQPDPSGIQQYSVLDEPNVRASYYTDFLLSCLCADDLGRASMQCSLIKI